QGSIGEHNSEIRIVGSHRIGNLRSLEDLGSFPSPFAQQHDGPAIALEQFFLRSRDFTKSLDCNHGRNHDGKRLFITLFATAQLRDYSLVACVADEMV